jgi:hypothetical protein
MRSSRGQAVADNLGAIGCVLLLLSGAALLAPGTSLPGTIARALAGGEHAPELLPAERALAEVAVAGAPGSPRVDDVVALVAARIGETRARALVAALAYDLLRAEAFGLARDEVETQVGGGNARVVTPAMERAAITALNAASRRGAIVNVAVDVAATGGTIAAAILAPEALLPGVAIGGISLVTRQGTGSHTLPAGDEAGDVVVCVPIRWRSTAVPTMRASVWPPRKGEAPDAATNRFNAVDGALDVIFRRGVAISRRVRALEGCA